MDINEKLILFTLKDSFYVKMLKDMDHERKKE